MTSKVHKNNNQVAVFGVKQQRLAQFKPWHNNSGDWEEIWSRQSAEKILNKSFSGSLGECEPITKYLPKDLPVLEAGCGLGQVVRVLSSRGYQVEGVDYAEETIRRVREAAPDLNVRIGDIYHLDVPNETYGGYISLGVLEHNPEGPLAGLQEARRVLRPQGFAFISVPYLNIGRRRLQKRFGPIEENLGPGNLSFYQYYFSEEEFISFLYSSKFEVIEDYLIGVYYGLTLDHPFFKWLSDNKFFHWRARRVFQDLCKRAPRVACKYWAHMIMYICKPI